MSSNEGKALSRAISQVGVGPGRRVPPELKAHVSSYAKGRRAQGTSYAAIGRELGLAEQTVQRWCAGTSRPAMVPVEVVAEGRSGIALVAPSGYRVEGLSLDELVSLLRALS